MVYESISMDKSLIDDLSSKEAGYWKGKEISDSGSELFPNFKRTLLQSYNGEKIVRNLDKKP